MFHFNLYENMNHVKKKPRYREAEAGFSFFCLAAPLPYSTLANLSRKLCVPIFRKVCPSAGIHISQYNPAIYFSAL